MLKIKEDRIYELNKFAFFKTYCGWLWSDEEINIHIQPNGKILVADTKRMSNFSYIPNVIFDLIQAGLVEKVSD